MNEVEIKYIYAGICDRKQSTKQTYMYFSKHIIYISYVANANLINFMLAICAYVYNAHIRTMYTYVKFFWVYSLIYIKQKWKRFY